MLDVYTAPYAYPGPDRLDVTRKTGAREFAPSWPIIEASKAGTLEWDDYRRAYVREMRRSYKHNRAAWQAVLDGNRVVLVCFCPLPDRCHRSVLAKILVACGARYCGELGLRDGVWG